MAHQTGWNTDLQLAALEGDVEEGLIVKLSPDTDLTVGRSGKGLRVHDPLVSIRHARIKFEPKRGYVVYDLDSATGTWVDEECIKGGSRPIGIGTQLKFGDTLFVVERRRRYPVFVSWIMAAGVLLGVATIMGMVLVQARPAPEPLLVAPSPVRLGAAQPTKHIKVPPSFYRKYGISITDLAITQVRDDDYDGRDEIWIRHRDKAVYVVTFNDTGEWVVIGELPPSCQEMAPTVGLRQDGFPALRCQGRIFFHADGAYEEAGQEGVVVWTRAVREGPYHKGEEGEPALREEAPPIKPVRVVLKDAERLAGFLAERGVRDPVHYIICDGAFPELAGQALTASGRILPLAVGCLDQLSLTDPGLGQPFAVALTAFGRRALEEDLWISLTGSADGMFASREQRSRLAPTFVDAGVLRGGVLLRAEATPAFSNPLATEDPVLRRDRLMPLNPLTKAVPLVKSVTIMTPGVAKISTAGCGELSIHTSSFQCFGACMSSSTFMRVEEVGCSETPRLVVEVPYREGLYNGSVDDLQVRVSTKLVERAGRSEVIQAKVAFRDVGEADH